MYLALARKYRPQKFKDLIGQPHVTKTLQNAIVMNKLYPALIFSGMKGIGKTSAARILAKTINCEKGPSIEPCNKCEICIEITEDRSSDYIEIDGASNNGVEEIRTLRETVKYKPLKNRYRVIVIDEVHMLSNSAWNALLKTIEEPPEHTYFIMATTEFHKIPSTIVSRCQHFEFKRIPYEAIVTVLKEISAKEDIKISDYSLYLIAKSSEGSLRDAKKVLDQTIALSGGEIKDKNVIDILNIIEEEVFINLTKNILTKDRKNIIEQINTLSERGLDLRFFYIEYLKFFRNLMIFKSVGEYDKLHNLNPENLPELKDILKDTEEVELLRYFNAAKDLEITMKHTENPRIMLEYLLLKLSYFPSLIPIEEVIEKINAGYSSYKPKNNLSEVEYEGTHSKIKDKNREIEVKKIESLNNKDESVISDEKLKPILVKKLEDVKPRLSSAISSSSIFFKENVLNIKLNPEFEHLYSVIKVNIDYLKKILFNLYKENVEINVIIDLEKKKKKEDNKISEIRDNDNIKNLLDEIKGEIISIDDT
jgi:DNA polymerase-3 subunit gamma/tau